MMRKCVSLLLLVVMMISIGACSSNHIATESNSTGVTNQSQPTTGVHIEVPTKPGVTEPAESTPVESAPTESKPSGTEPDASEPSLNPPLGNDVHSKFSYTEKDGELKFRKDDIVATFGDVELTNVQLQIYYWSEVYGFLNNYYYYLTYLGLDFNKPLDTQVCAFDKSLTWQQHFLENAIGVWQNNTALAELARRDGFTIPEQYRNELDKLDETLQAQASKGGFKTVEEMLQSTFGSCVTLEDYKAYMEAYYLAYAYYEVRRNAINPTMDEIEAYYSANEEKLTQAGIKKDGSYTIDVRHILVLINNVAAEMGGGTITEEHWFECKNRAQSIYNAFLAGDQSEKLFGELANQHSDDQGGNVTNGGLYSSVKPGDMVTEFNDWCFAPERKPGDTGLVKTQYGYHVMYFVRSEGSWITQTRSMIVSEEAEKILEEARALQNLRVDYAKILLGVVKI